MSPHDDPRTPPAWSPSGVGDPIEAARRRLQQSIRHFLVGPATPVRDLSGAVRGDPGYFGPGSITWRVHADASMLVGGLRSLLLQTMHPLAMAGVADHSGYRDDPTGRLWRTAAYVGTVTFGTKAEARKAVARVRKVHNRVQGTYRGQPYAANDPHLLLWVQHTLVDSFLVTYQRLSATPLTPGEADRYVAEQATVARLFGAEPAATSVAELRQWFDAVRPELHAGSSARDAVRFLLMPPLELAMRAPYSVIAAAAVGSLPWWVRWDLRLPILPVTDLVAVRPMAKVLTRGIGWALSVPAAAVTS